MNIKPLLIYISGVVTGVGATYFLFRKRAKFELERRLTEEMMEFKENYDKASVETVIFDDTEEEKKEESDTIHIQPRVHEERNTHIVDYYKATKKFTEDTNSDIYKEMQKPENVPYIVSEDAVYENKEYDVNYLTWYPDCDLLTEDMGGGEVEDIDYTVGYDNLKKLSADKPIIHVRNNYLKTDYEISINLPR